MAQSIRFNGRYYRRYQPPDCRHVQDGASGQRLYGQEIPVVGIHQGDCISFVAGGKTPAGDAAVSYTGLARDGKMETMWFVVADAAIKAAEEGAPGKIEKLSWWRSIITSADTFERVVR